MKAKELRIGNLFNYHGQSVHVMAIDKHQTEFGYFEDSIGFIRNCEDKDFPKPIHLTEKWLLKFGLKDVGDYIYSNGEIEINYHEPSKIYIFEYGRVFLNHIEIKYVHQLQNLYFALTGEELICKCENSSWNRDAGCMVCDECNKII